VYFLNNIKVSFKEDFVRFLFSETVDFLDLLVLVVELPRDFVRLRIPKVSKETYYRAKET
jgi:hypothetical protein